jgi:hypothetical protein
MTFKRKNVISKLKIRCDFSHTCNVADLYSRPSMVFLVQNTKYGIEKMSNQEGFFIFANQVVAVPATERNNFAALATTLPLRKLL